MEETRPYTRQTDVAIQVISENVTQLKSDFHDMRNDMKDIMKEFSDSVSKLVVLEEKSIHTNMSIERILKIAERSHERIDRLQIECHNKSEALEDKINNLEKEQPQIKLVVSYVIKGVIAVVALVGAAVMKLVVGA